MQRISLLHSPDFRRACIRSLRGSDERTVGGTDTRSAIDLLDRLLVAECDTDLSPGQIANLSPIDRISLLAALHGETFGTEIESSVNCNACDEDIAISFSFHDLIADLRRGDDAFENPGARPGQFVLDNGCVFQVPRGTDELAVFGLSPEEATHELLTRCIITGDLERDGEAVEEALEKLASAGDIELLADCPECRQKNTVRFNVQYYVLLAIRQERPRLLREIHQLAVAYRWSLEEILDIPRNERRTYASFLGAGSWQGGSALL